MASGPNSQGPSVFQGIGQRLKRAFTNSPPSASEAASESELSRVLFISAGAVNRAENAFDYRNTSERIIVDLKSAKVELEDALRRFELHASATTTRKEHHLAKYRQASIYSKLGDYVGAERIYSTLCLPIVGDILHNHGTIKAGLEDYEVNTVIT